MELRYRNSQRISQIKMLFASANISACLLVPPCGVEFKDYGTKTIEIPSESYAECIGQLTAIRGFRSQAVANLLPPDVEQTLVYPIEKVEISPTGLKASEFIASNARVYHVNVTCLDVAISDLISAPHLPYLHSLDLSRLTLNDENLQEVFEVASFLNLRWLDLSGNQGITEKGVRSVCEAIRSGRLKKLDGLDLTGTSFDASPFVDGHYWRINEHATHLAGDYGYQRWMMLGSRIPKLANVELLTSEQRAVAFGRLRLA